MTINRIERNPDYDRNESEPWEAGYYKWRVLNNDVGDCLYFRSIFVALGEVLRQAVGR